MSITKRVWIDQDPAYADVWKAHAEELAEHAKQFPFRLKGTRFELGKSGERRRSAFWPAALQEAIYETEADFLQIKNDLYFRASAERDRVQQIASHYYSDRAALFEKIRQRQSLQPLVIREGCCPECGTTMIRRTAKKGPNCGKKFWGCRAFPMCRGTRP